MGGIECGISGLGIAGLRSFASTYRKVSQSSIGRLSKNWLRNRSSLARITKLTMVEWIEKLHKSFGAKNAPQDDKGLN